MLDKLFVLSLSSKDDLSQITMNVKREGAVAKALGSSFCIDLVGLFRCYRVAICPGLLRAEGFPRTRGVIMNFYLSLCIS